MRNSIFASVLFTSFLFACGGEDGTTPVTTDDTGTAAADTGTSSTDDTGTSTTDTAAADDTGMTTTDTGGDTMMATDSPAADTKMDAPAMGATFTQVYAIFAAKCGTCHTTGTSGNLSLGTKADAYKNLVGKKAMSGACSGGGMTLVVAGSPDTSLLIHKLTKPDADVCGVPMPKDRPALPASEIATIRNWITAGAKND